MLWNKSSQRTKIVKGRASGLCVSPTRQREDQVVPSGVLLAQCVA